MKGKVMAVDQNNVIDDTGEVIVEVEEIRRAQKDGSRWKGIISVPKSLVFDVSTGKVYRLVLDDGRWGNIMLAGDRRSPDVSYQEDRVSSQTD